MNILQDWKLIYLKDLQLMYLKILSLKLSRLIYFNLKMKYLQISKFTCLTKAKADTSEEFEIDTSQFF